MKYNKSEIMKAAWNLFNQSKKWTMTLSFSVCLHRAWDAAKAAIDNAKKLANSYTCTINGVAANKYWYTTDRTVAERFC